MASALNRIEWVQANLGLKVSGACLFWCVEISQMMLLACGVNLCAPRTPALAGIHADESTRIRASDGLILRVLRICGLTQIVQTVVSPTTIYVVNAICRPSTMHIQPRKAMRHIDFSINPNFDVALVERPGNLAGSAERALIGRGPCEDTGFRVVTKNLFKTLLRQATLRLSHEAPRMLIGQRLRGVISATGPRHFLRVPLFCQSNGGLAS
jgi:hypothetical protein